MKRKFLPGSVVSDSTLSDRQIRVVANSGQPDRVGDVLVAAGCQLDAYRKNPIVLSGHDRMKPIGTARVYVAGERLEAIIDFAPLGASREADEVCALAKAGILGAVSVGFRPVKSEPIRGRLGGERFTSWELLELSVVTVPCDPHALVIERALRGKSGRVLNRKNAASLAELIQCLGKSEEAHADGLEMLNKADKHRAKAIRHAAAIAANQGTDNPDPDDGDDDDADPELAFETERRKRLVEIAGRTPNVSPAAARRARQIAVARAANFT